MGSLSDQIDRFTRNIQTIRVVASQTADPAATSSIFTRAVLYTHLGDLIRDIDPSELGLFTLVENTPYDKDPHSTTDPLVARTQFPGATPLKRRPVPTQEVEPEVYAHAALKYIEQYEPIRPMPRAYDRIVNILDRLKDVHKNIEELNQTLKQTTTVEDVPSIKIRVESEERSIKDLHARIAELSKKKLDATKYQKHKPSRLKVQPSESPKDAKNQVDAPSSPQEEQFWSNTGETGRTLRFTDNLLNEQVNMGDISTTSFDSPSTGSAHLGKSKIFTEAESFIDEPTITQFILAGSKQDEAEIVLPQQGQRPLAKISQQEDNSSTPSEPSLPIPSPNVPEAAEMLGRDGPSASETPGTRQRRIKVNREVEKIMAKIWATMADTIPPPKGSASASIIESISYIQTLASQTPQLESPITSSASSVSIETNSAPTIQQVLTAHLLTMLLSAAPHYSLPLNQVKENLALKAKTSGVSVVGQGTTRVLYGCVAKRLIKIDRGGREQIVKFDV